jgi:Zn-dependent protease with chaperone function
MVTGMQPGLPPASSQTIGATGDFHLDGVIPPRRIPAAYRLTLALSAFALVLLPLAYVGLIAAAAWGVWFYAVHGMGIFSGSGGGIWRLVLYVGPLAAGAILIGFMVKPLFARRSEPAEPLSIDLDQEPALRDLIRSICAQLRAPMPSLVNVDCQVNASARLRRGWVSLGRGDLALTIGLPLAANLSARQLAGVLAHEFGHFAQGGGMALTYVIRSINSWFARVVFERDRWDDQLEEWSQGGDARIALVLQLARGAVWISRRILHGLMYVGHAITCLQLRQMEYDADYYETHVAGSTDFGQTSQELARLGPAMQAALGELGELWSRRRLVDDLPGFVALRRSQLTTEGMQKISAAQLEVRTRWLDTHPSDRDRIAQAEALRLPGVFRGDGPASALFRDFAALCRDTSLHHYRVVLDLSVDNNNLLPVAAVARVGEDASAIESARHRLTGQVLSIHRPLLWKEIDLAPPSAPTDAATLARQFAAVRAELARLRESAETSASIYGGLHEDLEHTRNARAFLFDGIQIKPESFKLVASDLAVAERRIVEIQTQLAGRTRELAAFEAAVHEWVCLVVRAARNPTVRERLDPTAAAQLEDAARALIMLRPWFEALPDWLHEHTLFALYVGNTQALGGNTRFLDSLDRRRQRIRALPQQAREMIGNVMHPFAETDDAPTVAAALDKALTGVDLDGRAVVLIRLAIGLYFRLLGQLALMGEKIEPLLDRSTPAPSPCPPPLIPAAEPAPSS